MHGGLRNWVRRGTEPLAGVGPAGQDRGRSEDTAEEIAARTVNKERARAGESDQASATSTEDLSSSRRGGLRSHQGAGGRTKEQLYADAKRQNVRGRSTMTKAQLEQAVDRF